RVMKPDPSPPAGSQGIKPSHTQSQSRTQSILPIWPVDKKEKPTNHNQLIRAIGCHCKHSS
ncbi:MAG: hypothetical protein ACXADC_15005, partial [Candidatus Thorarchaeota archaeon]